jgi:hypothetical protein
MIQLIGVMNRRTGVRDGGLLRMFNWRIWHDEATNAPRRCPACHAEIHLPRNEPGFPDLVLVRGKVLWFVELKADRGRLSSEQRAWYEALQGVTQVHTDIWKPRDLPAIVETMR